MSQTWIPNTSGELDSDNTLSDSRGYINDALEALRSSWSGSATPSSPVRGQWFIDTDTNVVSIYNGSTWATLGDADLSYLGLLPRSAGPSYPLSAALYMGTNQIKGVAEPSASTDVATRNYVDTNALLKTGGTMTDDITMGANDIIMDHNPTLSTHLARKAYVDLFVPIAGGVTMTGALAMGTHKITGLDTPTAAADATTMSYVDGKFGLSTGHDHDAADSKKIEGSNLLATGASAGAVPYTVSGACSMVVPWGADFEETFDIGTSYVNLCSVTLSLPSTSTSLFVLASIKGNSGYYYDIKITDAADATLDEDTAWYNMPTGHLIPGIYTHKFSPATTGSYTIKAWWRVNSTGTTEADASLLVLMC